MNLLTMYDAVTPANIPAGAKVVAGYIDGRYKWTPEDWARFPDAKKVRVAVRHTTDDGDVCDCETGDLSATEVLAWVEMRRKSTEHPLRSPATVYTTPSIHAEIVNEFAKAGVAEPLWWCALWNDYENIPAGAVAHQYKANVSPGFDLSVVVEDWPNS